MEIWEDSRQQKGKHEIKHRAFASHGDKLTRCALPYGDYCKAPTVSVDTKANMQEIAQNIGGTNEEHARFRRELVKAKDNGCHLYILIENEEGIRSVDDLRNRPAPLPGNGYARRCTPCKNATDARSCFALPNRRRE